MVLAMSALLTKMPPAIESVLQETHMAEPLAPLRFGRDKRIIRTGVMLKKIATKNITCVWLGWTLLLAGLFPFIRR